MFVKDGAIYLYVCPSLYVRMQKLRKSFLGKTDKKC